MVLYWALHPDQGGHLIVPKLEDCLVPIATAYAFSMYRYHRILVTAGPRI